MPSEKRSSNFSKEEKDAIIQIVDKYKNIIENKKTNNNITIQQKREAWEEVTNELNSCFALQRTSNQVKKAWENIKCKTRKDEASRVNSLFKTGGGVGEKIPESNASEATVLSILGRTAVGLESIGDGDEDIDYYPNVEQETETEIELMELPEPTPQQCSSKQAVTVHQHQHTPKISSLPRKMTFKKREADPLSTKRIEAMTLTMQHATKESELKEVEMVMKQELHQYQIKKMKLECQALEEEIEDRKRDRDMKEKELDMKKAFHDYQLKKIKMECELLKQQLKKQDQ